LTTLYLAVHDSESDLRAHPFSTKALAERSVADYILRRLWCEADDEAKDEMQACYRAGDYNGVIEVWNAWSIENDYREEFGIQEKVLDAAVTDPYEQQQREDGEGGAV
jgi:hypothetical protein